MNEQLQQQFIQILKSVSESATSAKDFVLAELPDVVQQTMNWYLFKSLLSNFIALIFILLYTYLLSFVMFLKILIRLTNSRDGHMISIPTDILKNFHQQL